MQVDAPGSLMLVTAELLRKDKRTLEKIARGCDISFWWLRAMAEGRTKNPSVNRIQRLYEYLTGTKLIVGNNIQTRH